LEQIQQELARIDGSLNTDVRFLRDSIEQASLGKNRRQSQLVMSTINQSTAFVRFRLFYLAKKIITLCALS
jgi:hypothetical protein